MTFLTFVYALPLPSCPAQPSVLDSCSVQRVSHAMLHKIRKIVTHKYAHMPHTPTHTLTHPSSARTHCTLHATRRALPAACRTPRRGATEAVSQPVAHSHKCSRGSGEGKGGCHLHWQHARRQREEDPTQLSYKSNESTAAAAALFQSADPIFLVPRRE